MSEKIWDLGGCCERLYVKVGSNSVMIQAEDNENTILLSVNDVQTVSEIIEHLKTFMSKPFDPIKRSEIPTVEDIRLRLKEKLERDNEVVDKLVKHYTLKITEVMRKQEPTPNMVYRIESDSLGSEVICRLASNLHERGWELYYDDNMDYPKSSPYSKVLRWKPMNEEK